jgi:hypothetical protein
MIEEDKWNSRLCLISKVGHRVMNETLPWREDEESSNSTQLVIQNFILVRGLDFVFSDCALCQNLRIQCINVFQSLYPHFVSCTFEHPFYISMLDRRSFCSVSKQNTIELNILRCHKQLMCEFQSARRNARKISNLWSEVSTVPNFLYSLVKLRTCSADTWTDVIIVSGTVY